MHQERDVIAMQFELKNLTFLMRRPKQRALDLLLLAQLYRLVPGDELYSRSIPTSLAAGSLLLMHALVTTVTTEKCIGRNVTGIPF